MSKILLLLTDGISTIADSYVVRRDYVHPSRTGFLKDQASLRNDVASVGKTMSTVLAGKNGKQSNTRKGR